ncbi:hypothetical protein [Streptomyces bicolor]|uniref:hypothetical protein n=1 Tax=Streptomyces bicolor TaxID=66874 RepID=UPI0004E1F1E3|nr:hypothetical protein [Streptomyces bicolor]
MSYGQQGGPQSQWDPWKPHSQQPWNGGGADQTPDWAALAEASESRNKRRRLLFVGGGALATIAVGTAVAVAVVSANDNPSSNQPASGLSGAGNLPGSTTQAPSFEPTSAPPPLDPKDFISSKSKDTSPLGAQILFPGTQYTVGETVYKKGPTDDTKSCSAAAKGGLPKILTDNDCTRLLRVSYVQGGIAVTVGVAVFDTEAQATKAAAKVDPQKDFLRSLSGKGVKGFCNSTVCLMSANSYGRYAYFTITGFTSGKDVTDKDTEVYKASNNLNSLTYDRIHKRGEAQASAAANE